VIRGKKGGRLVVGLKPALARKVRDSPKAPLRRAPLLSSSFRQMRCIGLTVQTRRTARSDAGGLIRRR